MKFFLYFYKFWSILGLLIFFFQNIRRYIFNISDISVKISIYSWLSIFSSLPRNGGDKWPNYINTITTHLIWWKNRKEKLSELRRCHIINWEVRKNKVHSKCTSTFKSLFDGSNLIGLIWNLRIIFYFIWGIWLQSSISKVTIRFVVFGRGIVDPAFRLMRFPLDGELDFYLKNWFLFIKKMTWSRHLFLFYFKRVNKIRKKNPKGDSLFWKMVVCEKPDRVRGSGYLWGRYGKDRSTPLSP